MAKILNKNVLIIAVLAILVIVGVQSGFFNFGAQSIVSVSNINVSNQGQIIQATMAVNNNDTTWFINQNNIQQASNGVYSDVTKDIRVDFQPGGVFCTAPLVPRTITANFGLTNVTYWVASRSFSKDVITTVKVSRSNYASNVYDESVGNITFNACKIGACDATKDVRNSVNFTTPDSGTIAIENLGSLDNGRACPSEGTIAIVQTSSGLIPVDAVKFEQVTGQTSFVQCVANILQCIDNAINGIPQQYRLPSGYVGVCPQYTSCAEGFENVNTSQLTYRIPNGSSTAFITTNMNSKFIGAVVFSPASVKPSFVGEPTLQPVEPLLQQSATLTVNVKNNGDTGRIRVVVFSATGRSSISGSPNELTVDAGQTVAFTFTVTGANVGSDTLNITAEGIGSSSTSVSTTKVINIKQPEGQVCGDNVCAFGEQITCPQDCGTPPQDEICGNGIDDNNNGQVDEGCTIECPTGYVQQIRDEPVKLFGLIPIPFWNATVTTCVLPFDAISMAIIIAVAIVIAAFILRRK